MLYNYFLEIQDHGIADQKASNPKIIQLARELDIPLVATNDAHYITKQDAEIQKILVCIATKHTIEEDTGMGFETEEFYVKSGDEMLALFVKRMELSSQVAAYKIANGLPTLDRKREEAILQKVADNTSEEFRQYALEFFRNMMDLSKQYQETLR